MVISSDPATTAPACAMCRPARAMPPILIAIALTGLSLTTARAAEPAMDARIQAMLPELERVVADGMKAFDMPGLAIGIVRGDRLVYAKGFGTRGKADPAPVDTRTVFQIGSVAKSFLATTMAIAVDRGTLRFSTRPASSDCCASRSTTDKRMSSVASENLPFSRVQFQSGAIPFSASSLRACSFFDRCASPMARSTLGTLVNWILS
jgi:hypothetical protein